MYKDSSSRSQRNHAAAAAPYISPRHASGVIDAIKRSLGRPDRPSESHAHSAAVRTRQEPFADATVFFENTYNQQEREET